VWNRSPGNIRGCGGVALYREWATWEKVKDIAAGAMELDHGGVSLEPKAASDPDAARTIGDLRKKAVQ
jgi:hypothetical protein